MLNAEPVSFSEPFFFFFSQDSIKCRLPRNQAATRVEVLLSQLGSARGRDGANSSQQLNFLLLLYTEGGRRRRKYVGHLLAAL